MSRSPSAPPPTDREEALGRTPVKYRHLREERTAAGEVVILYPVTARPWIAALARWLGTGAAAPRTGRLQLDAMGSEVWGMLDGRSSLREIADRFAGRHRVGATEAQTAVAQFVRELGRRGLVALR
jgi:Coenzyme PQQ synthesis protein D (PqqD)